MQWGKFCRLVRISLARAFLGCLEGAASGSEGVRRRVFGGLDRVSSDGASAFLRRRGAVEAISEMSSFGLGGSSEYFFLVTTTDGETCKTRRATRWTAKRPTGMQSLGSTTVAVAERSLKRGCPSFSDSSSPAKVQKLVLTQNVFRWQTQGKQDQEGGPVHPHGCRWVRSSSARSKKLNLAGASGTGRTTFVNTLCDSEVLAHKVSDNPDTAHIEEGIRIKPVNVGMSFAGNHVTASY